MSDRPTTGEPVSTVHVVPVNDLIDHLDEYCPCGPTVEAVFRDDGSNGWLVTHHSLDGREHRDSTMTDPRPREGETDE